MQTLCSWRALAPEWHKNDEEVSRHWRRRVHWLGRSTAFDFRDGPRGTGRRQVDLRKQPRLVSTGTGSPALQLC
jgi:hypothetical protein